MEGRAAQELDPSQLKQFFLEVAGEDRVTITDNRTRKSMEPDDVIEECPGHELCGVGVAQGHKMSHLGEAVDDGQDD